MPLESKLRRGWRFFMCEDCGKDWKLATRDCFSPSGESCPSCGSWAFPHASKLDPELSCDELGNLTHCNQLAEELRQQANTLGPKEREHYQKRARDIIEGKQP